MTEKEKMLRGELYNANYDQDLIRERNEVKNLCAQYNRLDFNDSVGRKALLRRIILHMEKFYGSSLLFGVTTVTTFEWGKISMPITTWFY